MSDDELTAGLKQIAAKMAEQIEADAKDVSPRIRLSHDDGGRLIPDSVATTLRSQFVVPSFHFNQKWHEEYLAREAAMSRWAKIRRSVRWRYIEARHRLSYAWRHLRGIECPSDY